jgi:hypothetical protein
MLQMLVEQRRLIRSEGSATRVSDKDKLSSAASLAGTLAMVAPRFGVCCLERRAIEALRAEISMECGKYPAAIERHAM